MVLEVGRVCMKLVGREAGKWCVVLKGPDPVQKGKSSSFVFVTGPRMLTGVKRRKVNVNHLEPTQHKLEINQDENDENVLGAWEKSALIKKFNLKKPSAAQVKTEKTKIVEKPAPKAEEKKPKGKKKSS